ncbi:MAG TPA: DNA polymerase III subunit epsilon [Rhizomicrobium sp.]|nr:DNA polymerase III subunit epsilon [Rhizomicrobium sp.]
MREVVLDTETTGLDPSDGHRVIEIGCVELIDHMPTGEDFHVYLNPERDVPVESQRVHGLDEAFLADKPLFADVAEKLLEFLGDAPLVIHNAGFDLKFLNSEFHRVRMEPIPFARAIDTIEIAKAKLPGVRYSLDELCKRFGIDLSARTKHGALLDAELLARLYLELIGGRQTRMALAPGDAGTRRDETMESHAARQRPKPLGSRISAAETAAHTAFVQKELGENALWTWPAKD